MYRLTDFASMLRDCRRIESYTRALSAVISDSSVVLDLGAGIGTFSILACRLGAARVYAVEPDDVITVAQEHANANGVADRIRFIQARATEVELPEKVDVIVTDLCGALPLFEEHLPSVIDARERFLKPDGVLIPQRDRLLCAPLSSERLHSAITEPWLAVPDIDFGPAATMARHAPHALVVEPADLAAEPRVWAELDYNTITSPRANGSIDWQLDSSRVIHGIALWFESTLYGDVTYSSGPWFADSVHSTIVLPLLEPLQADRGDVLHLTIEATLASGRYVVTWQAGTQRQSGARQSTFLSEPRGARSLAARDAAPITEERIPDFATLRVPDRILCRRVGQEALLLDPASGVYHILNETGARVWQSLNRGDGIDTIAAALASDYEIDPAQAAHDVAVILAQLRDAGLLAAPPE